MPVKGHVRSWMFQGNNAASIGGTTTSTSTSSTTTTDPFIAQYRTVYDSMTTSPVEATADADNTMVSTLVGASLWNTKFDVFDVFAQDVNSDGEALKNFIDPGTNDPAIGGGAPTFTALEGFTGNGSNAYLNFFNPGDGGSYNYLRSAASVGVYIRNNVAEGKYVFGSIGSSDQQLQPRSAGDQSFIKLNDNSTITLDPITDSTGLWIISRTAAAVIRVYRNGSDIGGGTASSAALIDQMMLLLGLNNNGTPALFGTNQVSLAFAGGALTAPNVTTITNAIETRMDALGKGVIP